MPRPLPGSQDLEESNTRLTLSAFNFSNAELAVLQELLVLWHDTMELGSRPLLTPLSAYLSLPGLRAFWPLSSVDENGTLYDLSGQGRHLAYAGTAAAHPYYRNFTPTVSLASRDSDHFTRGHEPGIDFAGDFSFGLWFKPLPGCGDGLVMGKAGPAGTFSWAILLENAATIPTYRFAVSTDGSNSYSTYHTLALSTAVDQWHLLIATYEATGAPYLWLDNVAPAAPPTGTGLGTLYSSTQPLAIGHANDPSANYLEAEFALPFVCATRVPSNTINALYHATKDLLP